LTDATHNRPGARISLSELAQYSPTCLVKNRSYSFSDMSIRQITPLTGRRPRLPIIKASKLRVAQLAAAPVFEGVKLFVAGNWHELGAFAPHVLLATTFEYLRLIDRMSLGTVTLSSVDHAVFVITAVGDKPLSEAFRDLLWKTFRVPVYELYVDAPGGLLASECEAQEGWHIEPGSALAVEAGELLLRSRGAQLRTGLSVTVEDIACPCGSAQPRIFWAPSHKCEFREPALAAAS
jgi:hypothetical protein